VTSVCKCDLPPSTVRPPASHPINEGLARLRQMSGTTLEPLAELPVEPVEGDRKLLPLYVAYLWGGRRWG